MRRYASLLHLRFSLRMMSSLSHWCSMMWGHDRWERKTENERKWRKRGENEWSKWERKEGKCHRIIEERGSWTMRMEKEPRKQDEAPERVWGIELICIFEDLFIFNLSSFFFFCFTSPLFKLLVLVFLFWLRFFFLFCVSQGQQQHPFCIFLPCLFGSLLLLRRDDHRSAQSRLCVCVTAANRKRHRDRNQGGQKSWRKGQKKWARNVMEIFHNLTRRKDMWNERKRERMEETS